LEPLAKKGELIDFAPSVLSLLRRPVPAQMAGKALFE
jgi:bisphosphoglycerate-independent phosphoglycerate mutase (AlkP superfamily)